MLRKEVRGLALGGVYAIAVAVFGGLTQPAIAALIQATGDPLSPGLAGDGLHRRRSPSRGARAGKCRAPG